MNRDTAGAEQAHQQDEAIAAFERGEPSCINLQRTASCKRATMARHCKRDQYLFCPPGGCPHGDCAREGPDTAALRDRLARSCATPIPANQS